MRFGSFGRDRRLPRGHRPAAAERPVPPGILARVTDGHTRRFFARYDSLTPEQRSQSASAVLNKLEGWLAWPLLSRMMTQSASLSFRDLLDAQPNLIVAVALATDRYGEAAFLLGKLLLSTIQAELMHPERATGSCPP